MKMKNKNENANRKGNRENKITLFTISVSTVGLWACKHAVEATVNRIRKMVLYVQRLAIGYKSFLMYLAPS
jgi:hypothetical protein